MPCIIRGIGVFGGASIKKAVGRSRINGYRVFDTGLVQFLVKGIYIAGGNTLVGATEKAKDRVLDFLGLLK